MNVMHSGGVVHRDVKLMNFMVSGSKLFLIDFGLSMLGEQEPFHKFGSIEYLPTSYLNDGVASSSQSSHDW